MTTLALAYAYVCAHGPAFITVFLLVAPTLITGLSSYPQASGFVSFLKLVLNLLSIVSHKDSPGTFKAPLTISKAPDPEGVVIELDPPRGYAHLGLLVLLAGVLLVSGAAFAAEATPPNPEALADTIAQDPAAVQPPADPPPPAPKFGGCNKTGLFCWGPQVAAGLVKFDLKAKDFQLAFAPGLGYGVTFWTGRSYELGFAGYASVVAASSSAPGSGTFSLVGSFAEYLRFGAGYTVIGGAGSAFLIGGLGMSFGGQ